MLETDRRSAFAPVRRQIDAQKRRVLFEREPHQQSRMFERETDLEPAVDDFRILTTQAFRPAADGGREQIHLGHDVAATLGR